jgi:hypothetical protein
MFKGYKTYITAAVAIIGAVAGYLTGDLTIAGALSVIVPAVLGATIRDGINSAPNTIASAAATGTTLSPPK